MKEIHALVGQIGWSEAPVLIQGETGTGKEVIARELHAQSPRGNKPFLKLNCAALPSELVESELFGYERGAFTGAAARKEGRIERAQGGTLFLDEIGELSLAVQVKLLRFLQEGEIERLGGTSTVKVDSRVVAATNRDLASAVQSGKFREDLYYRLNVIQVILPPLRERVEDVPLLADHFVGKYAAKNGKQFSGITPSAMEALEAYPWPGNVRELEHAIERAVVLSSGSEIDIDALPQPVVQTARGGPRGPIPAALEGRTLSIPLGTTMEEIELRVIRETLRHTKGDKNLAAQLLGIAARTIYRKLDREPKES